MLIILPDYISDEIDRKLTVALAEVPDAEKDRAALRAQLIAHFAETGLVPDFSLAKNPLGDGQ